MSLSPKFYSEPILPHKPSIETPGSCTSRRSLNIRLPNYRFRSPVSTNSDRQLFNSNFSHLPAGAVVMLPPELKQQESCVNYFAKKAIDRADHSVPGKREPYNTIKKTMDYEEVQRVLETSKRTQTNLLLANKKKGSMFLSELWTKKQALKLIKKSELDKAYIASKEIEREGLPARLKKLENLYERRKDINGNVEMMDVGKIMQDFENQGINAPTLRLLTKKNAAGGVRTETSILDTEEELNHPGNERVKKLVPSLLGIPSSVYDGDTNDTMTVRSKSRSNVSVGSKVRSLSKLVLPKISSGTLTDLQESIQDMENNPNGNSNSLGYSRETGASYPILTGEEGQDLLTGGGYNTESSARERDRGKRNKTLGLRTIIEIAKGGKENKENKKSREMKSTRNLLTERSNKSYDVNVLKQKFEQSRVKPLEQSQEKTGVSMQGKARSYRNGRKNVWFVPGKRVNLE